jgi:hypothetical protein
MEQDQKAKLTPVFSLLESAVKTWWKNLKKIVLIYLWGFLFALAPLAVIVAVVLIGSNTDLGLSPFFLGLGFWLSLWAVLLTVYFLIRIYLSLFLLIKNDYQGQELKIYRESAAYFWSYISLEFLTSVLILLWFFALVIPALIFSIFYAFTLYAFFFEDKKSMDAVNRSYALVRGYWWPVLGRFLLIGLVLVAVISLISWPTAYLGNNTWGWLGGALVQIIGLLIGPVVMIFAYRLYRDLVKIKD